MISSTMLIAGRMPTKQAQQQQQHFHLGQKRIAVVVGATDRIPYRIGKALMTIHLIRFLSLQKMMTGMRSVHPKRRTYLPTRTIHQVMPSYGMRNDTFH
jgi:hypothetical protein